MDFARRMSYRNVMDGPAELNIEHGSFQCTFGQTTVGGLELKRPRIGTKPWLSGRSTSTLAALGRMAAWRVISEISGMSLLNREVFETQRETQRADRPMEIESTALDGQIASIPTCTWLRDALLLWRDHDHSARVKPKTHPFLLNFFLRCT